MIGKTIGNYRIDERLGEGGVGLVWRATDMTLDRPVALKVLRAEFAAREGVVERFRSEALTLGRLNHPNIATLYSFVCESDSLMMVMEYVQGQTFEHLVHAFGPMRFQRALPLFFQALDGIEYAHDHGIVHRDIKGSNVMLNHLGVVKVMDFGIARVLGSVHLTQTEHRVGTPAFMAPEQIRGEEAHVGSDVYSLGLLLYLLLTGKAPFSAKSDYELCRMHLEDAPPSPRTLAGDIPDTVEKAVLRALAKAPEERFASVRDFRAALSTGLVPTLTTPMGLGVVGSKRTVVLPEEESAFPSRATAKTVEFTEAKEDPAPVQRPIGADDEKTERLEALPTLPSRLTAPRKGFRRGLALAVGGATLTVGGATLAALAVLWANRLLEPGSVAPPQTPAPSAVVATQAGAAVPPTPIPPPTEPASEARAEAPKPPPARHSSKAHKRTLAKRAPRPAPPAKAAAEALPAAPDEGHEDGWVIRRR